MDMGPTQTYVPSVRGDAMLITHGRKGTAEDLLLAGAAVVIDAALGGHIDVEGRRLLGVERRRVVAGPELADAPPLLAELRLQVLAAAPDDPWGWIERAAAGALERVTAELDAAGLTTPLRLSRTPRFSRHETLIVAPSAEAAARARLQDALTGAGTPASIALGALLCDLGLRPDRRRLDVRSLPPAAQVFLGVIKDQRRRESVAVRFAA
jgi:hypothetical protein